MRLPVCETWYKRIYGFFAVLLPGTSGWDTLKILPVHGTRFERVSPIRCLYGSSSWILENQQEEVETATDSTGIY